MNVIFSLYLKNLGGLMYVSGLYTVYMELARNRKWFYEIFIQ